MFDFNLSFQVTRLGKVERQMHAKPRFGSRAERPSRAIVRHANYKSYAEVFADISGCNFFHNLTHKLTSRSGRIPFFRALAYSEISILLIRQMVLDRKRDCWKQEGVFPIQVLLLPQFIKYFIIGFTSRRFTIFHNITG